MQQRFQCGNFWLRQTLNSSFFFVGFSRIFFCCFCRNSLKLGEFHFNLLQKKIGCLILNVYKLLQFNRLIIWFHSKCICLSGKKNSRFFKMNHFWVNIKKRFIHKVHQENRSLWCKSINFEPITDFQETNWVIYFQFSNACANNNCGERFFFILKIFPIPFICMLYSF